jgi:hypothetical protein
MINISYQVWTAAVLSLLLYNVRQCTRTRKTSCYFTGLANKLLNSQNKCSFWALLPRQLNTLDSIVFNIPYKGRWDRVALTRHMIKLLWAPRFLECSAMQSGCTYVQWSRTRGQPNFTLWSWEYPRSYVYSNGVSLHICSKCVVRYCAYLVFIYCKYSIFTAHRARNYVSFYLAKFFSHRKIFPAEVFDLK